MSDVNNNDSTGSQDTSWADKYDTYIRSDVSNSEYKVKSDFGKYFFSRHFYSSDEGYKAGQGRMITGSDGRPTARGTFEDIENDILGLARDPDIDLTDDELADLNYFKTMVGISEASMSEDYGTPGAHNTDKNNNKLISDQDLVYSKYLRHNVQGNRLDGYEVPNYVFTLFMLKREKLMEYQNNTARKSGQEDSESAREDSSTTKAPNKDRVFSKPEPGDYVIIAQTGSTDLGIDDVNIDTYVGLDSDVKPLTINFKITEPGSITLLDRIAEAKRFCGYENVTTVPGLFLQLEFAGYPVDTVEYDERNEGHPSRVRMSHTIENSEAAYFELGGVTYDMTITPDGATYDFNAFRQKTGGRDLLYTQTAHTITGKNLTQLFGGLNFSKEYINKKLPEGVDGMTGGRKTDENGMADVVIGYGLQEAFNRDFRSMDREFNDARDTTGKDREFRLDISGFISNETGTDSDDPQDKVNLTQDTISNKILKDYSLLESFAKSGKITKGDDTGAINWQTKTEESPDGDIQIRSLSDSITVGGGQGSVDIVQSTLPGNQGYTDPVISINIPAGTHIKDCIYLILALSEDFVKKSVRILPDPNRRQPLKKKVEVEEAYVRWVTLDTDHWVDFSDDGYDEKKNTRDEYYVVKPVLSYSSNPNIVVDGEDFYRQIMAPTVEQIKRDLDALDIQKEYYYSYTGLNDQVLDIALQFDEAYALEIPAIGFGDYASQQAVATASSLNEEEAVNNTNSDSGVGDQQRREQREDGLFNTLKELSDGDLTSFAEYVGFTDEEIKDLVKEKNGETELSEESNQGLLRDLASGLSIDGLGDAVLSGYTSFTQDNESENTSPTESGEATIQDLSDNINVVSPYIYASALVLGLEGNDGVAHHYQQMEDEEAAEELYSKVMKPRVETVESKNIVKEVAEERNSLRSTTMSHLMRQHTNAASIQMLDMNVRGDPYWLGNDIFYDTPKSEDGQPDFTKKSQDVFFVMEAPRRLDHDVHEEDNNTGLFDYGNINYTLSGVYLVYRCTSNFSGGMFVQELNMAHNKKYEMTKIETVAARVEMTQEDEQRIKEQAAKEKLAESARKVAGAVSGVPTESSNGSHMGNSSGSHTD